MFRFFKKDVYVVLDWVVKNIFDVRGDDFFVSWKDIRFKLNILFGVE